MKIGVVGSQGIVGGAVTFGMELLNHDVKVYDIKLPNSKLEDVMGCEIVFVCVPTLAKENGVMIKTVAVNMIAINKNFFIETPFYLLRNPEMIFQILSNRNRCKKCFGAQF